jgi:hypothetical protein
VLDCKHVTAHGPAVPGSPLSLYVHNYSHWVLHCVFLISITRGWTCSPMVGRSSGTLPTTVQILVLAHFPGFFRIYRRYAIRSKRRSRRWRGANGDFRNRQICRCSILQRCS